MPKRRRDHGPNDDGPCPADIELEVETDEVGGDREEAEQRTADDLLRHDGWNHIALEQIPRRARVAATFLALALLTTAIVYATTRPAPDPIRLSAGEPTVTLSNVSDGLDVSLDVTNSGSAPASILTATYLGPGLLPDSKAGTLPGTIPAGGHATVKMHSVFRCPATPPPDSGPTSVTVTVANGRGGTRNVVLPLPAGADKPWPAFTPARTEHCRKRPLDELAFVYQRITQADPTVHRFTVVFQIANHGGDTDTVLELTQPYRGVATEIVPSPPLRLGPGEAELEQMVWTITDCSIVPRDTIGPFVSATATNLLGQQSGAEFFGDGYAKALNTQIDAACPT